MITTLLRLREGVEAARADTDGGSPMGLWQRALFDLADRHLADVAEYFDQLHLSLTGRVARTEPRSPGGRAAVPPAHEAAAIPRQDPPPGGFVAATPGGAPRLASPRRRALQQFGQIGTAEWDLVTDEVVWSEELFQIFGRDPGSGPLRLDQLPAATVEEDRESVSAMITDSLVGNHPVDGEFRVTGQDGVVRTVHLVGEPLIGPDGTAKSMWALVRDVSELRHTQRALRETRDTLLRERRIARAEHRMAAELQRAVLPEWTGSLRLPDDAHPALELATRYLPADTIARIGGDWYDALPLDGGEVLLTLGDTSGHGLSAASGMAMLRNALRALAITGARPSTMLGWLNELVFRGSGEAMASAVCGSYAPQRRELTWSQAGHPAPVLYRDGAARLVRRPDGVLLGAMEHPRYQESVLRLLPGDVLLFYTDGLVERREHGTDEVIAELLAMGRDIAGIGDLETLPALVFDRLSASAVGMDYEDDICVLALRVR